MNSKKKSESKNMNADALVLFLIQDKYRLIRHSLSIASISICLLLIKNWGEFSGIYDYIDWFFTVAAILCLFYFNMLRLIPQLLYKGKSFHYLFALISSIILACGSLVSFRIFFLERYRLISESTPDDFIKRIIIASIFLLPYIVLSTAIKLFQRWVQDFSKMNELETKAVRSELIALRNQIQPHFIFNMLNNINILIKKDPEKASKIIFKLSDFLRHLLYENNQKEVFISTEIRFMDDYLSLEKMRRDSFEYSICFRENDVKGVTIPPNIVLILVENAIKHSADPDDGSYVDITVSIEKNSLKVNVINSIPNAPVATDRKSGLGLTNITRRMKLIYGEDFHFNNCQTADEYIVALTLPL